MNGWIDNKFIESGTSNLGRQMNIVERRYYDPFGERAKAIKNWKQGGAAKLVGVYPWIQKWVGRNLQAQDVFLRTMAYEMQIVDAVRRMNLDKTKQEMQDLGYDGKAGYAGWVHYEMSMNNPIFNKAATDAMAEVAAYRKNLGLPETPTSKGDKIANNRFLKARTREIMMTQLPALTKEAFEAADGIARSQIFTQKRWGINGQIATGINKLKNANEVTRFILNPLIPFTNVVGNLGDTAFDYAPIVGGLSANGVSLSELVRWTSESSSKGKSTMGSQRMAKPFDPNKSWLQNRMDFATQGHHDPMYYEQMGRQWQGLQMIAGLVWMTIPGNSPLGVTWDDDRKRTGNEFNNTGGEYNVTWNGKKIFKYTDFPLIAAPFALVAGWQDYARKHPEDPDGLAARAAYAYSCMQQVPLKMSVGESVNNVLNMGVDVYGMATGDEDAPNLWELAYKRIAKPYLGSLTKALPQRSSFLEQGMQFFDPVKYDTKQLVNSLEYYGMGFMYQVAGKAGMLDIKPKLNLIGKPMKHTPMASPLQFWEEYLNEYNTEPTIKFLADRHITFQGIKNPELPFFNPDAVLGVEMKDLDGDQFYELNQLAGQLFDEKMKEFMYSPGYGYRKMPDLNGKPQREKVWMKDPVEKIASMDSYIDWTYQKGVGMTATEAATRKIMEGARKEAKKRIFEKYSMSEGETAKLPKWTEYQPEIPIPELNMELEPSK